MRKRRAVVVGFDYYAQFLADLMNEQTHTWRLRAYPNTRIGTVRALLALNRADALVCFGGPCPNAALTEAARRRNIPVFVIWAGSDVTKAQNDPFGLEMIKQERFIHLSDGPWLVDELRELGIQAQYLPLTAVRSGGPVKAFPLQFRVLTYLPEPRRDFYGADLVYDVARAMPDVPFSVVGNGDPDPAAPPNVIFHGRVGDMPDRIDESVVLLRHPQHDGKSMLVLEVLARARHVVWNYEFPHVRTARSYDDVLGELRDLRRQFDEAALALNSDGREYVLEHFSREDIAKRFAARLDAGVEDWAARASPSPHRVAISGLGLFCAEVAHFAQTFTPEWTPLLMRTGSRLEVLTSLYALTQADVWYSIGSPITDRWVHHAARLLRKARVIHWVGSDIAALQEQPDLRSTLAAPNTIHLAEVEWTARQLRNLGIEARIAPLPPRHPSCMVRPLPEQFTLLLYVPRTRADFYGRSAFEYLMQQLRGEAIKYVVVGGGEVTSPPGVDIENLGWCNDLRPIYERVSALIRYTVRDGLSLMVLEALSFGRPVLWTQDFPYTTLVNDHAALLREVRELYRAHQEGTLAPRRDAAEMIAARYSPRSCMQDIARAWSDAAAAPKTNTLLPAEVQ